VSYNTVLLGDG
jgi:hypothetical protein